MPCSCLYENVQKQKSDPVLVYQKENKNSSLNGKNKNVELEVEAAPLVHMEPPVVLVTPAHTLLTPSSLSRAAPVGLRGGIQRHRARAVDTQTSVPIPETSGKVTIDNIVVVVKDKVTNPLEPAGDDDGDPIEDCQAATGLNEDIV